MTEQTNGQGQGGQTPAPGTAEYNQMMAARYENQGGSGQNQQDFSQYANTPAMPDFGLEKFYNKQTGEYDYANHIKELNYRLDQTKTQPQQQEGFSPLNFEDIASTFQNSGKLSDEQYAAIERVGIPREVVDEYFRLQSQVSSLEQQVAIQYAGGQETVNQMFAWAKQNLTKQEIDQYNAALASPNWRMAIDSLKARSGIGAKPAGPELVDGTGTVPQGELAFASKAEMVKAMSDPRYRDDPAYRNMVRRRVVMSNF